MTKLRDRLVHLRRARRTWKMNPNYENAAALQRAQRLFDEAKREAIQPLD